MPKTYSQNIIEHLEGEDDYIGWTKLCDNVEKNWDEKSPFKEYYFIKYLSRMVKSGKISMIKVEKNRNTVKGHLFKLN
jgi:hypothetical protein